MFCVDFKFSNCFELAFKYALYYLHYWSPRLESNQRMSILQIDTLNNLATRTLFGATVR